ncbi:MAG: protein kinase [Armatimonadetes bacterium]|nr:protein kinase [Armatimonadota bacterium]
MEETVDVSVSAREELKLASRHACAPELPGYELGGELGHGSFGTVWEAIRLQTGQRVAVKLLVHGQRLDWDYFRRELAFLIDLEEHPYTLTVLDADLAHTPPYIVTPLVAGGSLEEAREVKLDTAICWIRQLAEALHYVHTKGIIHCDLKPSNIFVTGAGSIRVGDFGQSRRASGCDVSWGTIGFMSPEQCDPEKKVTPSMRWDVYGFGATAYWLLTGKLPRIEDSDRDMLSRLDIAERLARYHDLLNEQRLQPIRELNPSVDFALAALIESCLRNDPEARPQTMREVLEDLDRRNRREPLLCLRPWTPSYRLRVAARRREVQFLAILALFLSLFGFHAISTSRQRQFSFHLESGLHAQDSGRLEEAYLHWLAALAYRPSHAETRARLSFLPVGRTFPHADVVNALSFCPDGRWLATASADSTARIWEAASGREVAVIQHGGRVQQVAFRPHSPFLVATASWDGTARVFDIQRKRAVLTLSHPGGAGLTDLAWSRDGRTLATAAENGEVRLWHIPDGAASRLFPPVEAGLVQHLDFHPDGKRIAALSSERAVCVGAPGGPMSPQLVHDGDINDVQFSPAGDRLATCSDDRTVRIWRVPGWQRLLTLEHESRVNLVRFSPAGDRLAAAGDDGTVRVWEGGGTGRYRDYVHKGPVRALDFDRGGRLLVVGTGEKQILWSGVEPNGSARVWDLVSGSPVTDSLPHDGPVQQVLFSPDGSQIATASGNGRRITSIYQGLARTWRVPLPRLAEGPQERVPEPAGLVGRSPDGSAVEVLDAVTGRLLFRVQHGPRVAVNQFRVSPDARLLATASEDRSARIWQVPTGSPVGKPIHHQGSVEAVGFDPSGAWIATASTVWNQTTVRLWETATGYPVSPPLYSPESLAEVGFATGGEAVIGVSRRGAVYRWELEKGVASEARLREDLEDRLRARLDDSGAVVSKP